MAMKWNLWLVHTERFTCCALTTLYNISSKLVHSLYIYLILASILTFTSMQVNIAFRVMYISYMELSTVLHEVQDCAVRLPMAWTPDMRTLHMHDRCKATYYKLYILLHIAMNITWQLKHGMMLSSASGLIYLGQYMHGWGHCVKLCELMVGISRLGPVLVKLQLIKWNFPINGGGML